MPSEIVDVVIGVVGKTDGSSKLRNPPDDSMASAEDLAEKYRSEVVNVVVIVVGMTIRR